ncbi:SLATT domain-containing protein [Lutibacter sp. B2]|nr:SLATT domain-containing protein [Lutibacter sp. B2]
MSNTTNVKSINKVSDLYSSEDKWKSICDATFSNYSNMSKRFKKNDMTSKFILIYYSTSLIIYSLTSKFFPNYYHDVLGEYFSIIISIVILVYSIINMNAHYSERISKIQDAINQLKTLKREISHGNLEEFKKNYIKIVDKQELRLDIDFFNTVKQLCRQKDIIWWLPLLMIKTESNNEEEDLEKIRIKKYLSEIDRYSLQLRIIMNFILDLLLILIPVIILLLCILAETKAVL